MGKDEYFQSFRVNADNFICTLLPGISNHPQIQYSPGLSPPNNLAQYTHNHHLDAND
jgi:hypothetical protein